MAGPIRNSCVGRGLAAANTFTTAFQVPTGFVLLLKDIHLTVPSAVATAPTLAIQNDTTTVTIYLDIDEIVASSTGSSWVGWMALNQHDFVLVHPGGAAANYWVSGALLPFAPFAFPPLAQQLPAGGPDLGIPPRPASTVP